MKFKKIVSTVLLSLIVINSNVVGFAASSNDKYANYEKSIKIQDEESYMPKLEINYSNYENRPSYSKLTEKSLIQPCVVIPMEGETRITLTDLQTDGVIFDDDISNKTTLSNILNVSLMIGSYFATTVQNIVKDIAILKFGMDWEEVELTRPGQAKISHSYSYYSKLGQVWNGSYWVTKVDIEARKIYRHEWASFVEKDGAYTKTNSYDFTPINGYNEIGEEKRFEFDNNDWIRQEAADKYAGGWPAYVNAWTH